MKYWKVVLISDIFCILISAPVKWFLSFGNFSAQRRWWLSGSQVWEGRVSTFMHIVWFCFAILCDYFWATLCDFFCARMFAAVFGSRVCEGCVPPACYILCQCGQPMGGYTSTQMHNSTRVHKYTSTQKHKHTNAQQCTNTHVHSSTLGNDEDPQDHMFNVLKFDQHLNFEEVRAKCVFRLSRF